MADRKGTAKGLLTTAASKKAALRNCSELFQISSDKISLQNCCEIGGRSQRHHTWKEVCPELSLRTFLAWRRKTGL